MNFCTNCGRNLTEAEPFCRHCGAALDVPADVSTDGSSGEASRPASLSTPVDGPAAEDQPEAPPRADVRSEAGEHREHLEKFRDQMAAAWANGHLTPDAERHLAEFAALHHVTADEEARIRHQVLAGLAEMSAIDEEVESEPGADVELEINNNHFYMESHAGILDLRLKNRTRHPIADLEIVVCGRLLPEVFHRKLHLAGGAQHVEKIQVMPGENDKGEVLLPVHVNYREGGIIPTSYAWSTWAARTGCSSWLWNM